MVILSDVHGDLGHCVRVCNQFPDDTVLQLGDLGIGLFDDPHKIILNQWLGAKNFRFFCGNHDDRYEAKQYKSYIGDYGEFENIFYVCGAETPEAQKNELVAGVSWWAHEQLTHAESEEALTMWEESDKTILISHDCPQFFAEKHLSIYTKSYTRLLLDRMHIVRPPDLHIFGHHHKAIGVSLNKTKFICLPKNGYLKL